MIALIWLVAVLGLGNCLEPLPSRTEIETSINRTIDEVERMVNADPSLPRLSRSEIVDILLNITAKDMDSYEDQVEKTREQYQRALMVVLPYNSKDSNDESLKDLYTKAPHYEIVSDSPVTTGTSKSESTKSPGQSSTNLIDTKTKKSEDLSNESANHYKNHRETYTEVSAELPTEETLRQLHHSFNNDKNSEASPEKFTFNLADFAASKDKESSTRLPSLKHLSRNRSTPPSRSNLEIVYSTSVTQRPITTKTIIKTTENDALNFRPTMPPTRSTQNVLKSDQWRYNAPPATTTSKPRKPSPTVVRNHEQLEVTHFLPTMMTESDDVEVAASSTTHKSEVTTSNRVVQLQEDEGPDFDMANLRIINLNEKPAPFYVTPMSSTNAAKVEDSMTTANTPEVSKTPMPMREEVQTLLASIGLRPKEESSTNKKQNRVKQEQDKIFGTNFQIPESNDVINSQPASYEGVEVASPSSSQITFANAPQELGQGVNNLSPDVQLLFQRFGLPISGKEREIIAAKTTTEKPRTVNVKTSFWNNFKPLPASEVRDEGMKEFLAKFGLGMNVSRNEKAMKEARANVEDKRPSLIDAVPGNMRQILENIGLIRKSQRHAVPKVSVETTEAPQLHVFKPHETSFDNEKQRTKINELLDTVKQVQEGKADVVAVQKAAKELLETTKSLKNGPDPLSLEEILQIYNDDVKNEIKRQQDPKSLAEMATSESSDNLSTSTTTSTPDSAAPSSDSSASSSDSAAASAAAESPPVDSLSIDLLTDAKNTDTGVEASSTESSNLAALADSFGGSTAAPDPVLPTRRKTGLYFLVDWNTFLEVGEEGMADKVNLRFQPKAGDRTRFLPVTIP